MKKEYVSLKEAINLLNEVHFVNPEKAGRNVFAKQTIYNAIHSGRLKRFGPNHMLLMDKNELLAVFGPKHAS